MTLEDTTIDVTQSCTGSDSTHQPQIGSIYMYANFIEDEI
jgi:hypothetical protein